MWYAIAGKHRVNRINFQCYSRIYSWTQNLLISTVVQRIFLTGVIFGCIAKLSTWWMNVEQWAMSNCMWKSTKWTRTLWVNDKHLLKSRMQENYAHRSQQITLFDVREWRARNMFAVRFVYFFDSFSISLCGSRNIHEFYCVSHKNFLFNSDLAINFNKNTHMRYTMHYGIQ